MIRDALGENFSVSIFNIPGQKYQILQNCLKTINEKLSLWIRFVGGDAKADPTNAVPSTLPGNNIKLQQFKA